MSAPSIHASCVVVGADGVLIRGASGSGKSSLAAALIDRQQRDRLFGRLVADDRVQLREAGGRVVASAPAPLAGIIERRGVGLLHSDNLAEAVLRLVVDLVPNPPRLPETDEAVVMILGVALPRIALRPHSAGADLVVIASLAALQRHPRIRRCDVNALAFAPQHEKLPASGASASHSRTGRRAAARGVRVSERKASCAETA